MYDIGQAEIEAVTKVLTSKQFMRYRGGEGGYTEQFEKALQDKFQVRHALTVNSGTSALICALAAMGIGPGDEVIVPAYTWVATAMAPLAVGAVPVMADIDESLTIDPEDIERKITPYTKAIIPVHMINQPCNMDAIMAIAKKHHLLVCEDACQACGVSYHGKRVGTIGHTGTLSFNQFKNITCGEGGMLLTQDELVYQRGLMFHDTGCFTRDHATPMSQPFFPGFNFRVSEIQGAILGEQLKRLDSILAGLKERKDRAVAILSKSKRFQVTPENDAGTLAVGVLFPDQESAKESKLGLAINSGRHVYSNWEPLLNKSYCHPGLNPHLFAKRPVEYTSDMCPKTLDILSRSAGVGIGYNTPVDELEKQMKALV